MKKLIHISILISVIIVPLIICSAVTMDDDVNVLISKDKPWLGVFIKDLSEKMLTNMDLDYGVQITRVFEDSPAEQAGLEKDDIILEINDEKVQNVDELKDIIAESKIGDEIQIEYYRQGKTYDTKALIKERKRSTMFRVRKGPGKFKKFYHHARSTYLGVKAESLNEQLGEYFGVADGEGVLIKEVFEDSPADKAGLKAGDVIVQFGEKHVKNYGDLIKGLNYFDPGDDVTINIIRDKSVKDISVTLAEPKKGNYGYFEWDRDSDVMHFEMPELDIEVPEIDIEIPEIDLEDLEIRLREIEENEVLLEQKLQTKLKTKLNTVRKKLQQMNDKLKSIIVI